MKNREITLKSELERIIRNCDVCYIGMATNEGSPYVLPFNFGYSDDVIFLHSADQGKKINLLKENNRVCVAFSTDHQLYFQNEKVACSYSMKYKSVLVYGHVEFVENFDEKVAALNVIMANYSDREFTYNDPAVHGVFVFKVIVEKMAGRAFGY